MDHTYATTNDGHFVEIISLGTDNEDGTDYCQIVHHETDTAEWVRADSLTTLHVDQPEDDVLPAEYEEGYGDGYEGYSYY